MSSVRLRVASLARSLLWPLLAAPGASPAAEDETNAARPVHGAVFTGALRSGRLQTADSRDTPPLRSWLMPLIGHFKGVPTRSPEENNRSGHQAEWPGRNGAGPSKVLSCSTTLPLQLRESFSKINGLLAIKYATRGHSAAIGSRISLFMRLFSVVRLAVITPKRNKVHTYMH